MRSIAIAVRLQRSMQAAAIGAWRDLSTRTRLLSDARSRFGKLAQDRPEARQDEAAHGRKETRTGTVISAKGLA